MVVGVVVGGEHNQDRPGHARVNVVRHNALKYRPLKDAIELPAVLVEVVSGHRVLVFLVSRFRLVLLAGLSPPRYPLSTFVVAATVGRGLPLAGPIT